MAGSSNSLLGNKDSSLCGECVNKYRRLYYVYLPTFIGGGIGGVLGLISYVKGWF